MIAFLSSSQGSHIHASALGVWTWPAHGTARQCRILKSRALRSFTLSGRGVGGHWRDEDGRGRLTRDLLRTSGQSCWILLHCSCRYDMHQKDFLSRSDFQGFYSFAIESFHDEHVESGRHNPNTKHTEHQWSIRKNIVVQYP